jgi:hypothetical protein
LIADDISSDFARIKEDLEASLPNTIIEWQRAHNSLTAEERKAKEMNAVEFKKCEQKLKEFLSSASFYVHDRKDFEAFLKEYDSVVQEYMNCLAEINSHITEEN